MHDASNYCGNDSHEDSIGNPVSSLAQPSDKSN